MPGATYTITQYCLTPYSASRLMCSRIHLFLSFTQYGVIGLTEYCHSGLYSVQSLYDVIGESVDNITRTRTSPTMAAHTQTHVLSHNTIGHMQCQSSLCTLKVSHTEVSFFVRIWQRPTGQKHPVIKLLMIMLCICLRSIHPLYTHTIHIRTHTMTYYTYPIHTHMCRWSRMGGFWQYKQYRANWSWTNIHSRINIT